MRTVVHRLAGFLVTATIAVACAPQTEVVKLYDDPSRANTAFKHLISNLYDATTQERVWAIQSTCFEKSSISEILQDESGAIVRQLRIDELI